MAAWNPAANEIFLKALETTEPAERKAYLDRACGVDTELRRTVDLLLRAHAGAAGFLEKPAATAAFEATAAIIGTRIGPYKLLQKLGEGGMGAVYMAEQEEPVKRRVALKIIKAGMDSAHVLARFEQERQALALMDHPNIAKVLDAGTTADRQGDTETGSQGEAPRSEVSLSPCLPVALSPGLPYFVMELVKGIPITKYCDQEHLSPKERLELFIPVCQAVQHAHQKGIIHRDLKPSNVIVALYDGKPVPKVIDFGVAKATQHKLTERTMFTEVGQIVGTLEYMAPEQAELNNLDIDTRADIYSLGVLLYELLTGSPPFPARQLRTAGYAEMLRIIKEIEPPRPSTKLSSSADLPGIAANRKQEPRVLCKLMHGDLDWIVMKCLEKDRGRRFETANGLALDIQRYLADEPVLAGPPSKLYKLRKFVRRNRVPVAAAAVVFLALVAGIIGTTLGLIRATRAEELAHRERDRAEDSRRQAEESFRQARATVDEYFTTVSENQLLNAAGLQPLRKDLLDRALKYYQNFLQQRSGDPGVKAELAATYYRVAWITNIVGPKERAVDSYEKAISIYDELIRTHPDVERHQIDRAIVFNDLGNSLAGLGRSKESLDAHRQALAVREVLARAHANEGRYQNELAKSHANVGAGLWGAGQLNEALASIEAARAINEKWAAAPAANLAAFPTDLGRNFNTPHAVRLDLALNYRDIGGVLYRQGRTAESARAAAQARDLFETLVRERPEDIEVRSHLAASLMTLGFRLGLDGRQDESLQAFQRALEIITQLAGENPSVPNFQSQLAFAHRELGRWMRRNRRFAEAQEHLEKARVIQEKLVRAHPAIQGYSSALAYIYRELGWIDRVQNRPAGALAWFGRARAIDDKHAEAWPGVAYDLACDWAICIPLVGWGKEDMALTEAERAERRRMGDEAMQALRRAVQGGWRNLDHLSKDEDMDPLRSREDFRKLVEELKTGMTLQSPKQ
jgi:serine/threonine protein kinase